MNFSSNKWFKAGGLLCLLIICAIFWLKGQSDRKEENGLIQNEIPSKRTLSVRNREILSRFENLSQRDASTVYDLLSSIQNDLDALLEVAPRLAASSHANDRYALNYYIRAPFSPQQFAEIITQWEGKLLGEAILLEAMASKAVTKSDPNWTLALGTELNVKDQRDTFWIKIAKKTDMFAPENLQSSLELLPVSDKGSIVNGIVERLISMSYEDQKLLVSKYYEVTSDAEVLGPMTDPLINHWGKENPSEAVEWLLSAPPEVAEFGDRAFIHSLDYKSIALADSFVNELYAIGQTKRASTVAGAMSEVFFRGNPSKAIEWISQLPPQIEGKDYLLTQNFSRFSQQDWEGARDLVKRLNNEQVSKAFAVVEKTRKE